jgi:phosphoglucomutase/phosphomannomutase
MSQAKSSIEIALNAIQAAHAAKRLSASAAENIRIWLSRPQYADYAPTVVEHIAQEKWRELDDAFWTTIPFGTAGRRGRMCPIGTNAINQRTIGESVQGLADYLGKQNDLVARRCAIAYDTRHRSREFAELSAEIMVANGFEVIFFDGFRATPELSFTVRDQKCACGIMISASHNPPSDNAIKVFWSTGGQLRPPHDEGVIECVGRVTEIQRTDFKAALDDGRIRYRQDDLDSRYQSAVLMVGRNSAKDKEPKAENDLRILYSPLHGVGLTSILPILQSDGFANIEVFQTHAAPDGDFPNVPDHVANPENPAVFNALIEHAQKTGAELILASDPDADRIGCAARRTLGSDDFAALSGNQIGVLLGEYMLRWFRDAGRLTPEHYVIKTLVTSDMVCRVAEGFGAKAYGDVLTGFKWIGSLIDEAGPDKFVFGFEEAHGYLAGTYTRDKDGAVAAMLLAELATECKAAGITLHDQLDRLFLQFGCHQESSMSHTLPGADGLAQMQATMARLRKNPPHELGGLRVRHVRDYLRQEIVTFPNREATHVQRERQKANVPASDLLIFDLEPAGNWAAIRPSGTEPKLKFYLFAYEPPEKSIDLSATKSRLSQRLGALQESLLHAARGNSPNT